MDWPGIDRSVGMAATIDQMRASVDSVTNEFAEHRNHLFSVAYSILGSIADTEDVIQEVWVAWAGADHESVANPRAYLIRIAVNTALSRLKSLQKEREAYIGPWLPEPLVTDATDTEEKALRAESVSLAMMVVLEALSPLERAVFVLDEAFGYKHAEIAEILGRTPAAVRQLARRARTHVQERRRRFEPPASGVRQKVIQRFLKAAEGGDVGELLQVLAPDVEIVSDAGGTRRAALRPIRGRDKAARFLAAVGYSDLRQMTLRAVDVNGEPGIAAYQDGRLAAVGVIEVDAQGQVFAAYGVFNPAKLGTAIARENADE